MSENKALNVKQLDVGLTPNIGFFLIPASAGIVCHYYCGVIRERPPWLVKT